MTDRFHEFSDVEFLHLHRYPNGRIKNLPAIFYLLTPSQVEMLHSDDWSYYHELQMEMRAEYDAYMKG